MKSPLYAVLSDIHGNYPALKAVEKHAREAAGKLGQALLRFICLGDVVDYGPQPDECMRWVQEIKPVIMLRGNHDADVANNLWAKPTRVNEAFWPMTVWTRMKLARVHRDTLSGWPEVIAGRDGLSPFYFFHAHPRGDDTYINSGGVAILAIEELRRQGGYYGIFGHTHYQGLYTQSAPKRAQDTWPRVEEELPTGSVLPVGQWHRLPPAVTLLNPGSVGQPRFHASRSHTDSQAAYMLLQEDDEGWRFQWQRVSYEIEETVSQLSMLTWPGENASDPYYDALKDANPSDRRSPANFTEEEFRALEERFPEVKELLVQALIGRWAASNNA